MFYKELHAYSTPFLTTYICRTCLRLHDNVVANRKEAYLRIQIIYYNGKIKYLPKVFKILYLVMIHPLYPHTYSNQLLLVENERVNINI